VTCFSSLDDALLYVYFHSQVERVFVIGGAQLYQEALRHPDCHELLVNRIIGDYECDTFFPDIDLADYRLVDSAPLDAVVLHEIYGRRPTHIP
jgi:dihydrofolate reductase